MLCQGALYHCHTPSGELVDVLWFMVPTAHWVDAMNGCHKDAGCQGQQQTLYLLHDQFWWSRIATQMQKVISKCEQCVQHEGTHTKPQCDPSSYCSFGVVTQLFYQYWDNYRAWSTPKHGEHFSLLWPLYQTHHALHYPDQTVKTFAKFLWQGYISIFRALAKLLSDWGANFESNIIREFCKIIGIWKVRTSPYHAQANGQVEWAHQSLMHMIGKLRKDRKLDSPRQLP